MGHSSIHMWGWLILAICNEINIPTLIKSFILMRLKTIIFLLIGFGFLTYFTSCNISNNRERNQFEAKDIFVQLDSLLTQLNSLEAWDCKNLNEIVTLNEKMRRIIEGIRSPKEFDELVIAFDADKHKIGFLVSEDDQFGVFSWQTKMDCLGHGIKNIALYKSNDKVMVSSLYGDPMVYHNIKTNKQEKGKPVYILLGISSTENDLNNLTKKGYKITNGYLVESKIPQTEKAFANN